MEETTLGLILISGLMAADPAKFIALNKGDAELTIKFPSAALVGFGKAVDALADAGYTFTVPTSALLERTIGFLLARGMYSVMEELYGSIGRGKEIEKEAEGARGEGVRDPQGTPEAEG